MMSDLLDDRLYADRDDWKDVVPIAQYQDVDALAPINYSPEYQDATSYFRGIVQTGEMSPRVLELTETIIRTNPAHYSAWQYRYRTLLALQSPLDAELRLMDQYAIDFLKTYQVWHHRRLLLTALHKQYISSQPQSSSLPTIPAQSVALARTELAFLAQVLESDAKNYHTWSYRQWVLAHFNDEGELWAGERAWTDTLLENDVRNNSAWHHRFFVVWASGVRAGDEDREVVLRREVQYTKDKIALAPNNLSAWNYLRGVLEHTHTPFSTVLPFVELYTSTSSPMTDIIDLDNPAPSAEVELPCVYALEFRADAYEREGGVERLGQAVKIWKSLGNEHDRMRKKYWEYRIKEATSGA